jgi:hypothetical protein
MDKEIIFFYCVADDFFKTMHLKKDRQALMNKAKVVTVALTTAQFFGGNLEKSRAFLRKGKYISYMLSKSRLCWHFHAISDE